MHYIQKMRSKAKCLWRRIDYFHLKTRKTQRGLCLGSFWVKAHYNCEFNYSRVSHRCKAHRERRVHFTLVHRYDFITGKRADIRRGDSWGWGFFHERLIRPYIYVDETIGVGNKKQTRPIVVRCPQRRSLVGRIRRLSRPCQPPTFPRRISALLNRISPPVSLRASFAPK